MTVRVRPYQPVARSLAAAVLACLAAPRARAQEPASAPPPPVVQQQGRPMPKQLQDAVSASREATKQYKQAPEAAGDELVGKASGLLDRVAPQLGALPIGVEGRKAASSAHTKKELGRVAQTSEAIADVVERTFAPTRTLVVSGGVSMGSYQAGFLYFYGRALRFYDERLGGQKGSPNGRFQIATGASAGSINSFLAAVSGCLDAQLDPEQSLFFRTWTGIGLAQLIPHKPQPSSDGLFSESAFTQEGGPLRIVGDLWKTAQPWAKEPCETALAITATRLAPRRVAVLARPKEIRTTQDGGDALDHALQLDRMTEKFLLSMKAKGDGSAPTFTARRFRGIHDQIYPTLGDASTRSDPDGTPATPDQIVGLLQASSAFPLAFSPKPLPVTTWTRKGDGKFAPAYEPRALFTDGGFLDNTPLRIAQKLAPPRNQADPGAARPRVLVLMSGARSWERSDEKASREAEQKSVFARYLPFFFNFLSTASDGALIDVFEDDDGSRFTYDIPMRAFPIAADHLGHFFAFAEPSFRRFDFYQGMVDAEELIAGQVEAGPSAIPFERGETFECFRDFRRRARPATGDEAPALGPACAKVDANLGALLRASAWRRQTAAAGGDNLEAFLTALQRYHFKYQELAKDRELSPTGVAFALRAAFDRLGTPFASAQPDLASELGIAAVAPVAIDLWRYRPRTYLAVGLPGEANLQLLHSLPLVSSGRLTLRLQTEGYFALYPRRGTFMTGGATESHLRYPFQLGVGAACEVVVRTGILFELGVLGVARSEILGDDGLPYLRKGIEGQFTLAFGERLFVSLSPAYFFQGCAGNNACPAVRDQYATTTPAFISKAPYIFDNAALKVSAGWRFLW